MPTLLRVTLRDGRVLVAEVSDYEGFHSNPMRWESVVEKFDRLSESYTDASVRREIVDAVRSLEAVPVQEFAALLARVQVLED